MFSDYQEMCPLRLRYETESALEESLKTGIDPRKEYEQLVSVLQQKCSCPSNVGEPGCGGTAPEGRFWEAMSS